jgi:hypothetical protein
MARILTALCLASFLACCASEGTVSGTRALEIARTHLTDLDVPTQGREISVTPTPGGHSVVFHLPPGMLGGDFTVKVSDTGEVLSTVLER